MNALNLFMFHGSPALHESESWMLAYLLNSLWQVPLIFLAAWLTARLLRQAGPRVEHRVWTGALLLEVGLPACHIQIADLWQRVWSSITWTWSGAATRGSARVAFGEGVAAGGSGLHLPGSVLAILSLAYAGSLVYFAACLAWGLWKTSAMRRSATPGPSLRGVDVEVAISPLIYGPSTVGFRRAILLLPPSFLEKVSGQDLDAALAHEYAHIERHDFAKNLFYQAVALPVAYHPVLWMTQVRIAETREMICDAMAAETVRGPEGYARSLLRLASALTERMPARTLHAIGIFDANNFERRIMNLIQKRTEMTGVRRWLIGALCGVVGLGACASALALRVDVSAPGASETSAPKGIHIPSGVMAGTKISGANPVYPKEAKASGKILNGTVVLAATIGKDGSIQHLAVKKSLRGDYDRSAIDAVHTWLYKPYLLNGEPVEVETTINITFSIQG